jgi:hypothetical protein
VTIGKEHRHIQVRAISLNTITRPPWASATQTDPSLATFRPSGTLSAPSVANLRHGPTEPSSFTS